MNTTEYRERVFGKDRIVTIALVTLCLTFQALSLNGVALFLPDIRKELGLSFTEGGALSAVSLLTYAFIQIPAGYLADRIGSRKIFFIGALGLNIFSLAFGLISSYWQGIGIQVMSGFFRAFVFVPSISLLTAWFSPNRRATATALSSVGLFLSQVLVNSGGPLLANEFDWRIPFIAFSAGGIIFSFIYVKFARESPTANVHHKVNLHEILNLFSYRFMWVCGGIQFVRYAIFQGIATWLPSLLIDEQGISLQVTGMIMVIRALVTSPSQLLGGYISDKLHNPTLIIQLSLVILLVTTTMLVRINDIPLLIGMIMINAVFVQFYFGPLFAMPVDRLGQHMTGTITGVSNFYANLGGFTAVYILGILKDISGSFASGFYFMAGLCLIGLLLTVLLSKTVYSQQEKS
jgi:sugar phosphate permease